MYSSVAALVASCFRKLMVHFILSSYFFNSIFPSLTEAVLETRGTCYTVQISNGDSEILHEIVRDTTRKYESMNPIRVVLRTISYSFLESQLHFISFLTVINDFR